MARGTKLSGSTVLVTGGGSGLGRRMALLAAERGARVLIWDLSADGGTKVRDEIRAAGGSAEAQTVNIAVREAVKVAAVEAGPVDVLINNAGVVSGRLRCQRGGTGGCGAADGLPGQQVRGVRVQRLTARRATE